MSVQLFTIGFTKKPAKRFFALLRNAGVKRILDIRLNNTSQLSGFAKKDDLDFFLQEVGGINYIHIPELAPTQDILDALKKHKGSWTAYEKDFKKLMAERSIETILSRDLAHFGCLLCSEEEPEHCHRRLIAEYLQEQWDDVSVTHLV